MLLLESDDRLSENYILPKSLCICMIRYQAGDKELGGAEVQEGEAKEQGQATLEEEPQEAKAKKIQASGRGTTVLAAVLPRHGTTASTTASNREIYGSRPRYYRTTVVPPSSRYYRAACAQKRAYDPCIRVWTPLDYKYKFPYEFWT